MTAELDIDTSHVASDAAELLSGRRSYLRESLHFIRLWLRRPVSLGAVLPSSRALALAMAEQVDHLAPGVVVELGGGTGSITAALLDSGVPMEDLVVIEREPALAGLLRARFPGIHVICGDACELQRLVVDAGLGPVKSVVSGLPLLSLPDALCRDIIDQVFLTLQPYGTLVQFTYGPRSPVPRSLRRKVEIIGERASWVLENLPPASVWSYHRRCEPRMPLYGSVFKEFLHRAA